MTSDLSSYRGYRFPPEIIAHAVWLYFRFSLSFRDVEDLLAQRGIIVTYETIRQWCRTFGRAYAIRLRHRRGQLGDTWHFDELFVKINGRQQYLWRAVDEDGRSGPRNLDSGLSEISIVFQAAVPKPVAPKYTTSGVRRPSEL